MFVNNERVHFLNIHLIERFFHFRLCRDGTSEISCDPRTKHHIFDGVGIVRFIPTLECNQNHTLNQDVLIGEML